MCSIGMDLDNTIIIYDRVIHRLTLTLGLAPEVRGQSGQPPPPGNKKMASSRIKSLPGGDRHWQRIQAQIYGPLLGEADLAEGFRDFALECKARGLTLHIVSHKTRFANNFCTGTDFHAAAASWLEAHGFFSRDGFGLSLDDVYFEPTRAAKVRRIAALGCDAFIDDLPEVFAEEAFPAGLLKVLYDPAGLDPQGGDISCRSWADIARTLLRSGHD